MRQANAIRTAEIGITSHTAGVPFAVSVMLGKPSMISLGISPMTDSSIRIRSRRQGLLGVVLIQLGKSNVQAEVNAKPTPLKCLVFWGPRPDLSGYSRTGVGLYQRKNLCSFVRIFQIRN